MKQRNVKNNTARKYRIKVSGEWGQSYFNVIHKIYTGEQINRWEKIDRKRQKDNQIMDR